MSFSVFFNHLHFYNGSDKNEASASYPQLCDTALQWTRNSEIEYLITNWEIHVQIEDGSYFYTFFLIAA